MKLIINADDFGKNPEVNQAVMASMEAGICCDTTLLVNFENSSAAARWAVAENRDTNVGIHINLTQGHPLTGLIRREPRFCDTEGFFHYKKQSRLYWLSRSERKAVRLEVEAQINLCRSWGIGISHADSHNHVHEEPAMLLLLVDILKEKKIPGLRLAKNVGNTKPVNQWYRSACNFLISRRGLALADYFGSTADLNHMQAGFPPGAVVELMIHPGRVEDNGIIDVFSNENLTERLAPLVAKYGLTSYAEQKLFR